MYSHFTTSTRPHCLYYFKNHKESSNYGIEKVHK
jgi:hypothetical protein